MATKRTNLRAVAADEAPAKKLVTSLLDAIEHGTHLDVLEWQRRDAVKSLATLAGPALAAMHRQIASLSRDIEAIKAQNTEGTDIGGDIATPDEAFDPQAL